MGINKERKIERNMLDILVVEPIVEDLSKAKTEEAVKETLTENGINPSSENIDMLKNVFTAVSDNKKLEDSGLERVSGGIDWKSDKAKKAYKIISGVVGGAALTGTAYLLDNKFNEGKGMKAIKEGATNAFEKGKNLFGKKNNS